MLMNRKATFNILQLKRSSWRSHVAAAAIVHIGQNYEYCLAPWGQSIYALATISLANHYHNIAGKTVIGDVLVKAILEFL